MRCGDEEDELVEHVGAISRLICSMVSSNDEDGLSASVVKEIVKDELLATNESIK